LTVWQNAHALALAVYRDTASFPAGERFGLTSQLRRAASSVAANIAEGCGRDSAGDMRRSLQVAMGSATETDYHLLLARDLGFLAPNTYSLRFNDVDAIQKMLAAFIVKLR
jgi:four helix bundle protein